MRVLGRVGWIRRLVRRYGARVLTWKMGERLSVVLLEEEEEEEEKPRAALWITVSKGPEEMAECAREVVCEREVRSPTRTASAP